LQDLIEDPPEENTKKNTNTFCVHQRYVVWHLLCAQPGFAEVLIKRIKPAEVFYKVGLSEMKVEL
jgi:hypothetical protein